MPLTNLLPLPIYPPNPLETGPFSIPPGIFQAPTTASRNSFPTNNPACVAPGPPPRLVTDFSWELFKRVQRGNNNLILNPTTVQYLLSLLANGASDSTYQDLCRVVKFGDAAEVGRMLESLITPRGEDSKDEFVVGNAVFVAQGTQLNPDFQRTLSNENTKIQGVDLVGANKDKSIRDINQWAAEITRGKIPQILNPSKDYSDTKLLLASAVYFRGSWQYKFKPSNYSNGFRSAVGRTVPAEFMTQNRELKVGEVHASKLKKDVARFVDLPYSGDRRFSMIVVLPYETETLDNVIDNLEVNDLIESVTQRGGTYDVNITMPKFEIRSSQSLVNPLTQMGLGSIFSTSANFPHLIQSRNAAVSDITQEAFLSVDEKGTQAGKFKSRHSGANWVQVHCE